MFICLEVDESLLDRWVDIDKMMSENLGFTHILWGTNKEQKKLCSWRVPETLYVNSDIESTGGYTAIANRLYKELEELLPKGGWNALVMPSDNWAISSKDFEETVTTNESSDLETVRQE